MIYTVRVNKRLRYIKVYAIKQKVGHHDTFMTKFFTKIFNPAKKEEGAMSTQ
ncbi:MAG TPA: hypothetical protein VND15_03970 [Candidatus Acidoferrales bacterium]|nr:hypothetical protein [Candidatus Acidoferrales bacterium]